MSRNNTVYLALGANLGNIQATFDQTILALQDHKHCKNLIESPRYKTAPIQATGPAFINSVLKLSWSDSGAALLETCMALEDTLGRQRTTTNAPRNIDIDILLFGNETINNANLNIPHPRMHLRRFVLQPLTDLDSSITIPHQGLAKDLLKKTLRQKIQRI